MPLYIAQFRDLDRCHGCLTDSQTLKDRATQLLIKYTSGALVTEYPNFPQEGHLGPPVCDKKSSLPQDCQLGPPLCRHGICPKIYTAGFSG